MSLLALCPHLTLRTLRDPLDSFGPEFNHKRIKTSLHVKFKVRSVVIVGCVSAVIKLYKSVIFWKAAELNRAQLVF